MPPTLGYRSQTKTSQPSKGGRPSCIVGTGSGSENVHSELRSNSRADHVGLGTRPACPTTPAAVKPYVRCNKTGRFPSSLENIICLRLPQTCPISKRQPGIDPFVLPPIVTQVETPAMKRRAPSREPRRVRERRRQSDFPAVIRLAQQPTSGISHPSSR